MQITKYYTFVDGKNASGLINADRLNGNLDAIINVVNGNLEDDNVKTGAKVLVRDRNYTGDNKITGSFEFDAFPTVPDASVPDAKLSANIPKINAQNDFSAQQKFSAGFDGKLQEAKNFKLELLATLPAHQATDKGRLVYALDVNKAYAGLDNQWKEITSVEDYTGGAVRAYSQSGVLDDGDGLKFWFKTEGASPTVKIAIKGEPFPKRYYTELGEHNHAFTGIAHSHGITDPQHYHTTTIGSHGHGATEYALSTHTHSVGGSTGTQSASHKHSLTTGVATADMSQEDISHTHGVGSYAGQAHTHGAGTLVAPAHTHGAGTLGTGGVEEHTHSLVTSGGDNTGEAGAHSHDIAGSTASGGGGSVTGSTASGGALAIIGTSASGGSTTHKHTLSGVTDVQDASHSHSISLTSGTPSASQAIAQADLGNKDSDLKSTGISINDETAGGTIGNKGVNAGSLSTQQKLYAKNLTVKINGVSVTSDILTATGWSDIGDGTENHAFHADGSGEMNASTWVTYTPGFHTLEIIEPEGGYGTSVMIHIETN